MKEREESIDYLRALGIVLMVLAHIPLDDKFVHYVHAFHMPLFFVISGYLRNGGGTHDHLKNVIKKLLKPYIVFSILGYILWFIEVRPIRLTEILSPIKAVLWINSEEMPIAGALWFLTAMAFVNVFVYCIENQRIIKNKEIFVLVLFLFGLFETRLLTVRLPWSIGAACVGTGFFYVGVKFRKYWDSDWMKKIRKLSIVWYIIASVVISVSICFNGRLNMRKGEYACIPLTIINSILFIWILWLMLERLMSILELKEKIITNEIKSIGRYSIIYLCCNELVINVVKSGLRKINISSILITVLLVFIFLKICEKVFMKTPMKMLIG